MARVDISPPISKTHPQLAAEWHPRKNMPLKARNISAGSSKQIWWQCSIDESHVWQTTPAKRARRGYGCPYCSGRRVCETNCLATTDPEVAASWHPSKNLSVTPNDVTATSNKRAWWVCIENKDHEWDAIIYVVTMARRKGRKGCPYCHGKRADKSNSLAGLHPELANEWHNKKNGKLTPSDLTLGSDHEVWWKCPSRKPAHVYQALIRDRVRGTGCPYCSNRKVIADQNSIAATHPQLARQWHKNKNAGITPEEIYAGSHVQVWWKCARGADHVWQAEVRSRALKETGCPYCANLKVAKSNSLASKNPKLLKEWHYENNNEVGIDPHDVFEMSSKKVWWQCGKSSAHVWLAAISERSNGSGCPFCANRKLCDENRLSIQFPGIAAEWHPTKNGELKASDVVAGARRMLWWQCLKSNEHEWRASLDARTKVNGSGCPFCAGKRVASDNSLKCLYPQVVQNWHKTKNGNLSPDNVRPFSHKKMWWQCFEGHVWQAEIASVVNSWITYRTNGCLRCDLEERAKNAAKTLKGRARADRKARVRLLNEDEENRKALPDPSILR